MRLKTVDLLERISEHEAGIHWWKALSRFEKLAYFRIKREAEGSKESGVGGDNMGVGVGVSRSTGLSVGKAS